MNYYALKRYMFDQVDTLAKTTRYSESEICYMVEKETGMSEKTIMKYIEKLKLLGYVGKVDGRLIWVPIKKRGGQDGESVQVM